MKRILLSLIMATTMVLLLGGCGEDEPEPESSAIPVEVALVERGSISAQNQVSGQVISGSQEMLFVVTNALCTDVYVEAGQYVSQGQAICTLDMAAAWANYDTAVASYNNAVQSYNEQASILAQQVEMAEKNVADTEALFAIGAASQLEVDSARLQLEGAVASMNATLGQLEVGIKSYEGNIAQLETTLMNIDRSGNVIAPISGNVVSLSAMKNVFVSPSSPLAVIDSATDMEVTTFVSEALIPKLAVGGPARVSISSVGREFDAVIESVGLAPNQQTRLFPVTVQIPAASAQGLITGMFADVTFFTDTQSNVIVVPSESIQTGIDSQYVYTVDSDHIAHRVNVQTGLVGDGITEITAGLTGGEKLVTVGQFYLSDGAEVRIVSAEV